jgi:hypothetical protein
LRASLGGDGNGDRSDVRPGLIKNQADGRRPYR